MGIASRLREIWYEEGHAPLYLVALPARLDAPHGCRSGWNEQVELDGVAKRAPRGVFHASLAVTGAGSGAGPIEFSLRLAAADGRQREWTRTLP